MRTMSAVASPHASASIESIVRQAPGYTWISEVAGTAVAATITARIAQACIALRGESCMMGPSKAAFFRPCPNAGGYGGRVAAQGTVHPWEQRGIQGRPRALDGCPRSLGPRQLRTRRGRPARSEERRVGKECGCGWAP